MNVKGDISLVLQYGMIKHCFGVLSRNAFLCDTYHWELPPIKGGQRKEQRAEMKPRRAQEQFHYFSS